MNRAQTSNGSPAGAERLHGLDAVRGYALLLGVIYHATMAYLPGPQIWPVKDNHESLALSGLFFVSHTFRMTTFFLIAGFFAHLMVEKRGVAGFIKDRAKRIALPLVAFWPISIGGIVAAAAYAIYVATGQIPTHGPPPAPNPPFLAFPLTHLWFLYLLLWLYAGTLVTRWLVVALDRKGLLPRLADQLVRGIVELRIGAVVLALPVFAAFALTPSWLPWFGVTTPDSSLIPNPIALTQFGAAFGFGWLLRRQADLLQVIAQRWAMHLGLAVLFIGGQLAWMGVHPMLHPAATDLERLGLAAYYAVGAWTATLAAIGLALRFLSDESPARRYIADSSYWVYLVHLPIVMALQAAVSRLDWPWEAKFAVVLGVGFALMFASYQLLVRRTWIGAILNGRRVPKPARPAPALQPEAAR
jgi:peptidoglycan/LPS O-acetylase OafA/YrhL